MTKTAASKPDPFDNVRATAQRLRGRAPDEFSWFIKSLEDLKQSYFEACAVAAAGDVLSTQGRAQCVAKLLFELQNDAP